MKPPCLTLVAALALALLPLAARAQASAPPPAAVASAPPAAKPGPRLLTPEEKRDSAVPAGELRPERQVTPQISIPFGKKPPAPLPVEPQPVRRGSATAGDRVDDPAARCEAQAGEQVRAKCRDKLAREARESIKRAPD